MFTSLDSENPKYSSMNKNFERRLKNVRFLLVCALAVPVYFFTLASRHIEDTRYA
jgi:hypothetical protein